MPDLNVKTLDAAHLGLLNEMPRYYAVLLAMRKHTAGQIPKSRSRNLLWGERRD